MLRHVLPSLLVVSLSLIACNDPPTGTVATKTASPLSCPTPTTPTAVLVDASHDGGVWWFPQVAPFDSTQPHQGQALADTLRAKGYRVDELGRGKRVTRDQLLDYPIVIRAGSYGAYGIDQIEAYLAFVACPRTGILLGDNLRPDVHDDLADSLGIALAGWVTGGSTSFATDPITAGVSAVPFIAGSVVDVGRSRSVQVLGWLND